MKKYATLHRTAFEVISPRSPDRGRKHVRQDPDQRIHPLLMTQWKQLRREEFVELRHGGKKSADGWVDGFTPDGAVVWIQLTGGLGRVMIHRDDGFDIWRTESRTARGSHTTRTYRVA